MKLCILGTQSPAADFNHNCPGYLVTDGEYSLLLDCGSGTHSQARDYLNFPACMGKMAIIISHLHRDHYSDIFNYLYYSFTSHRLKLVNSPIQIYMPANPSANRHDICQEENAYATYKEINENVTFQVGKMHVSFCRVEHEIETYAVKITDGTKTIIYSSDTSYSSKNALVAFAKDADIFICESSFIKEHGFPEICSHLTAHQAGTIAKEANVKKLLLTHFYPDEERIKYLNECLKVFDKVELAEENINLGRSTFEL